MGRPKKSSFLEEEDSPTPAVATEEEDIFGEPQAAAGKTAKSGVVFDLDSEEGEAATEGAEEAFDAPEGFEEVGAAEEPAKPSAGTGRFPRAAFDSDKPLDYKPQAPEEPIPADMLDCFGLVTPEGPACKPDSEECSGCDELEHCKEVCRANKKAGNITRQKGTGKKAPAAAPKAAAEAPAKKPAAAPAKKSLFDEDEDNAPAAKPAAMKPETIPVPKELGKLHPQVANIVRVLVSFGEKNPENPVTFEPSGEKAFFVNIKGVKRFRVGKKELEDFTVIFYAKKVAETDDWEKDVQDGVTRWGYKGDRKQFVTKLRKMLGV